MGTPGIAARCLEALIGSRHEVVAAVSQPDRPSGRGMKLNPTAVKAVAEAAGVPVFQPTKLRDGSLRDQLAALSPDVGVVVAYGRILPADLFELPPHGCINAHASILPALRGAAPIQRAIVEGLDRSGVTIMKIAEEMDAGDTLLVRETPITAETDGPALHDALAELAAGALVEACDMIADGSAVFTPQDHEAATFAPPITNDDTRVDWSEDAARIERKIRAFRPRPGAFTFDAGKRLKLLRAEVADTGGGEPGTVIDEQSGGMVVACGNGALRIVELQPEGKKAMPAADYARGRGLLVPRLLTGEKEAAGSGHA